MTADAPPWRRLDALQAGDAVLVEAGPARGPLPRPQAAAAQQHGNQIMPVFPPILDEELAFFLGYMAGDGFVARAEHDHRVGVSVAHDSYLIDEMPALLGRIFGSEIVVVHRMQKPQDASVTFVLDNRAVKETATINGLGKATSVQVRVPRLIRQSPPEVVGAYLRGLFEADGSVLHGYPQLLSSSEDLIRRDSPALLIGLGCPVRIATQPTDESHYGTAPMWKSGVCDRRWALTIGRPASGAMHRSRFTACLAFQPDQARRGQLPAAQPGILAGPGAWSPHQPAADRRTRAGPGQAPAGHLARAAQEAAALLPGRSPADDVRLPAASGGVSGIRRPRPPGGHDLVPDGPGRCRRGRGADAGYRGRGQPHVSGRWLGDAQQPPWGQYGRVAGGSSGHPGVHHLQDEREPDHQLQHLGRNHGRFHGRGGAGWAVRPDQSGRRHGPRDGPGARDLRPDRPAGPPQRRAGRALPGCGQPPESGAAPLRAGSDESVRRAVAGAIRKLLSGVDQPGGAPHGRGRRGLGTAPAQHRGGDALPG